MALVVIVAKPAFVDDSFLGLPENRIFLQRIPVVGIYQCLGCAEKQSGLVIYLFNVDGGLLVTHGDFAGGSELQCFHHQILVGFSGGDQPGEVDGRLVMVADVSDEPLLGTSPDRDIPLLIAAQPQL